MEQQLRRPWQQLSFEEDDGEKKKHRQKQRGQKRAASTQLKQSQAGRGSHDEEAAATGVFGSKVSAGRRAKRSNNVARQWRTVEGSGFPALGLIIWRMVVGQPWMGK